MSKPQTTTETALNLKTVMQRLCDSRIDTVGDEANPKSIVETFWLNELELAWRKMDMDERRRLTGIAP